MRSSLTNLVVSFKCPYSVTNLIIVAPTNGGNIHKPREIFATKGVAVEKRPDFRLVINHPELGT